MAKKKNLEQPEPKPRRKRRWWLLLVVLLAVGWFAPAIVMRTPLKRMFLDYANPGINADIEIESSQLSWLSPVVLRGVRVRDKAGVVAAEADVVASQRTLWNLATDYTNLGLFSVDGVRARVEATDSSSNLEEILAPMFVGPSTSDKYRYRIEINDGAVVLFNKVTSRTSQFTNVRGYVNSTELGNAYPDIAMELLAHPDEATDHGGELQCNLSWEPATPEHPIRGIARVRGTNISLQSFGPAVSRFMKDTYVDGNMKCDFAFDWSDDFDNPAYRFRGGLSADQFHLTSAEYLGADRLNLKRVQLGGGLDQTGSAWSFEQLRAKTDFADVTANGAVLLEGETPVPSVGRPFSIDGTVDVADLANRLPNTLQLQDGIRMTEGVATIALNSQRDDRGWVWNGNVKTNTLRGERNGQRIEWDDPLTLDLRLRNHQDSYVIENVSATSDFLTVSGNGTLDKVHLDGACDLNQLKNRLDQFVDMGAWQMTGKVAGVADFTRDAGGRFAADAKLTAKDFAARASADAPTWREANLKINARATGQLVQQQLTQMDAFTATLTSGSDRLSTQLLKPVAATSTNDLELPLAFRVEGNLETWLPRLQPVIGTPVENASGAIDLQGTATASQQRITIPQTTLTASNLRLPLSEDLIVVEPKLAVSTLGRVDLEKFTATFPTFELTGTALQAAGKDVHVVFADQLQATARLAVTGELARISRWQTSTTEPTTGQFRSDIVVATKGDTITAKVDASLQNSNLLSMLDTGPDRVASNPNAAARPIANPATLSCTLRYDQANDKLQVQKARVDSDAISLQVGGSVKDMTTVLNTNINGNVAYDFEHLNAMLRSSFGDHVKLIGRGSHPFRISGPLTGDLKQLTGSGKVNWDSAAVYGLKCGPGVINANIAGGILRTEPIQFELNRGTATLLPTIDLREDMTLYVAKGTAIQNVQLTEEVTSEWMKFVAPLLADSARVQGRFSASVTGAKVPLDDPMNGDIAGSVQIHSAQADPGPVVERLVGVIDQVRSIIGKNARGGKDLQARIPEQDVQFRMVQQRVHHQNFLLKIDGVPIRTSGSVGLDQTLNLVAELTLPDKWLGNSRIAKSLSGRALKIPVTGTFKRPRVDPSVLRTLGRDAAAGAANNLLKDNLDRGLNKLFDKIK